jgi:hypothetical protein
MGDFLAMWQPSRFSGSGNLHRLPIKPNRSRERSCHLELCVIHHSPLHVRTQGGCGRWWEGCGRHEAQRPTVMADRQATTSKDSCADRELKFQSNADRQVESQNRPEADREFWVCRNSANPMPPAWPMVDRRGVNNLGLAHSLPDCHFRQPCLTMSPSRRPAGARANPVLWQNECRRSLVSFCLPLDSPPAAVPTIRASVPNRN